MYWKIASCLILFIFFAWVRIELALRTRKDEDAEADFWERERASNSVRRKPIDHLDYINVPEDLPFNLFKDNEKAMEIERVLNTLRDDKILNLTGMSNTDIKMEYGTANLTELSRYDQNYTTLSTQLQKLSDMLIKEGHEEEAIKIMEFMVDTGVDIKKTYIYLGQHYLNTFNKEKFDGLVERAETLNSFNRQAILNGLTELN